jgi:hypothetical protein
MVQLTHLQHKYQVTVSSCCSDDDHHNDEEEEIGKLIDQWNKLMPLTLFFKSKHTKQ